MENQVKLMPRTFVVHPYFIEPILIGKKISLLTQADIMEGTPMIIEAAVPDHTGKIKHEVPFATAIVAHVQAVRLNPNNESIEMHSRLSKQWHKLSKDGVCNLIKFEGFEHKDDFWKNIDQNKQYEAIHITFDNLKPYKKNLS
jgi:16S rRNA C1402 N4-methylase RsmH